jgi:hypothetical protein
LEEYVEVGENIRHWQNMRFVSMTVFMAIMGALAAGLFQFTEAPPMGRIALRAAGLLIAICFWIMDERIVTYWKAFVARAQWLDERLGFQQYRRMPARGVITSGNAVRALYLMFVLFWGSSLVWRTQF